MSELDFFGHIIDGAEVESVDGGRFDVWNPWTQEVWAQAARAPLRMPRGRSLAPAKLLMMVRGRGWAGSSGLTRFTSWPT